MTTDKQQLSQYGRLLALHEDVQPASYTLEADICTIGRSPVCQVVVQRNVVSRLHARVQRDELHYVLHDAGSANGTFVNGRRSTRIYCWRRSSDCAASCSVCIDHKCRTNHYVRARLQSRDRQLHLRGQGK